MSAISTLVIGLGGTGVLSVRALKKLWMSELRSNERVDVQFLAFDFDRSSLLSLNKSEDLADLDEGTEFHYLDPQVIQDALRNLDRVEAGSPAWGPILEWFPDRGQVKIPVGEVEANGAGQLRALGRLGFFLNDESIERRIRQKLRALKPEVDSVRLSTQRRVILISSLAGGTGAGMLVDIAYIARRQEERPRVYAYLLLPEVFEDVDSGGRIYQNSYACLKELAHLKDQLIPFHAPYLKIPPVDISAGGAEPFARIFLSRSNGGNGSDAIVGACIGIARSVLGQLQVTIQEKTLSIVSNTASSNALEEQRRRRTHCFSTATSEFVPLKLVPPIDGVVLEAVVRAVKDPAFLEWVVEPEIPAAFAALEKRLLAKGGAAPAAEGARVGAGGASPQSATSADESLPEGTDEATKSLVNCWRGLIERQAKSSAQDLVRDLVARLDTVREKLGADSEKIAEAENDLREMKELVLDEFDAKTYLKKLESLSRLTAFTNRDKDLRDDVRTLLRTALQAREEASTPLRRRAYLSRLLSLRPLFFYRFPQVPSERVKELRDKWKITGDHREKVSKLRFWQRIPIFGAARSGFAWVDQMTLRQALQDGRFAEELQAILRVRAITELEQLARVELAEAEAELADEFKPWKKVQLEAVPGRLEELNEDLRKRAEQFLRDLLPQLLIEARDLHIDELEPEALLVELQKLVSRFIGKKPGLGGDHFLIEWDKQDAEERLLRALLACRQRIFERRTPNPQHKAFTLIMLPVGVLWNKGDREALRRFLSATAGQVLGSRVQVVDYSGARIWFYAEDLFNPGDHLRNLDEYYRQYQSQTFRELFHIDRRFLAEENFRELISAASVGVVTCGNKCRHSIANLPRTARLCPGCGELIRSRCGNVDCSDDDMMRHNRGGEPPKTCPSCGGFNHSAWWICCEHGKTPVEIPIDKEHCPQCIEAHHEDPIGFPRSRISMRLDRQKIRFCPRCEDLAAKDSEHKPFQISADLLPYFRNGVNGHDRRRFEEISRRLKLPDRFRCPNCRTPLIPVHHSEGWPECSEHQEAGWDFGSGGSREETCRCQ
jgi:hypothetical protein